MKIETAFETLRAFYGSHQEAAKDLGIGVSHYLNVKNGKSVMTKRMKNLIRLAAESKAKEGENESKI